MSFIATVYIPEAIVMAADSRQSIRIELQQKEGNTMSVETIGSDSVYKSFLLQGQGVGLTFAGDSMLGGVTTESHVKRFVEEEVTKVDDVTTIVDKVLAFFKKNFPDANTTIQVAGFKKDGKKSIPYVFVCHIGRNEKRRMNVKKESQDEVDYGVTWGGEGDIIARLLTTQLPLSDKPGEAMPPIPVMYQAMSVQDAIDFAAYLVRTTSETMRFQARKKTVGGPIDILLLTPDESMWVQKKELKGEKNV